MTWTFDRYEVLKHTETGAWWHVLHRWECVDSQARKYELEDATRTERQIMHAEDVEGDSYADPLFESAGWKTQTKPAAERGYRVNGVLTGPSNVDYWKNSKCKHDVTCSQCGEDGMKAIDCITDIEKEEHYYECRTCGHVGER